jgi:UDP-N-acetylmuramate--alanine ligase
MDLASIKKVYIIGIKGSGIVGIAEILKSKGIEVTGSDTTEKFFTDEVLQRLGISYVEGFAIENIPSDVDLVLYAASYNEENNIEVAEAKKRGLETIYYPKVLSELFNEKYGVAICGTHGKTTTSAMLAYILDRMGENPTAIIGGRVRQWGSNAIVGQGEVFVLEADEYQNKLALYEPKAAILTSVEYDHPDFYPTFEAYEQAFVDFVVKIPKSGFLAVWGDSVNTVAVAKNCTGDVVTYGYGEDNDFRIGNQVIEVTAQKFEIFHKEQSLGFFEIKLPGKHNALNALSVIVACYKLGLDMNQVREALSEFEGTTRRFELIGQRNGAILIDDYGHHPEEVNVTLKAAREIYPEKNIIAVFHPHSYSRTAALLHDFAQSFDGADHVIVLDIYGSARENSGTVTSLDLVNLINKYNRDKAEHIATIDEVVESLQDKIGTNDVVITIGAGNVFEVSHQLKQ